MTPRGLLIATILGVLPISAAAQSSPSDRIDAIERQIRSLQDEVKHLKRELSAARRPQRAPPVNQAQSDTGTAPQAAVAVPQHAATTPLPAAPVPEAEAPTPSGPHVTQSSKNRFGLESANGRYSIALTGRLHLDAGDYLDYHPQSRFASVQNLNSGVNARRARLGVVGKFAGDWNYTLIFDLGGSSDGLSTPGARRSGIQNAFITYNGLNKGPMPLAFDLGYLDTPFTLGRATSSNDILLVERPSAGIIASDIMAGDSRSALGVRSNDDRYWAGVYLTGPRAGDPHNTGEQMGAVGRAAYQVLQQPDYALTWVSMPGPC